MKNLSFAVFVGFIVCASNTYSWDGYDSESGESIEIEKGNLVRRGQEIEFYDYEAGEYRTGEVESIRSVGNGAEVEVYDHETDETRTFEMD